MAGKDEYYVSITAIVDVNSILIISVTEGP